MGQSKPNFVWSLHGPGEQKFVHYIWVTLSRWPPCRLMVNKRRTVYSMRTWVKYPLLETSVDMSTKPKLPFWIDNCPYPSNICTKYKSYCFNDVEGVVFFKNFLFLYILKLLLQPNKMTTGHKTLCRQALNDHNCQIWFSSLHWLWRKCNLTMLLFMIISLWELSVALATKQRGRSS